MIARISAAPPKSEKRRAPLRTAQSAMPSSRKDCRVAAETTGRLGSIARNSLRTFCTMAEASAGTLLLILT